MSSLVFFAVLFSALFQGGWNFLAKKSRANKIALLLIGFFLWSPLLAALAFFLSPESGFEIGWLPYILATGVNHATYFCALGWAYEIGEVSVVYPIARGLGIVGTTALSLALGLHGVSFAGGVGIAAVVLGTMFIGLRELPHQERQRRRAFLAAILVAANVTAYTIVDSYSVKFVPPVVFLAGMNLTAPLFAAPFVFLKLGAEARTVLRSHKLEAIGVSGAGSIAYIIILWCYQRAPASYVAALREVSVLIAVGLGVFILREDFYRRKAIGVALILLGAALIKLA